MEDFIKAIAEKTGLPVEKAKQAAEAAIEFIKDKLPEPIAAQIEGFLSGAGGGVGGMVEGIKDKLGGLMGKG